MSATHRALVTNAKTWSTPSALPFVRQAARTELIEQSHQRCAALGDVVECTIDGLGMQRNVCEAEKA